MCYIKSLTIHPFTQGPAASSTFISSTAFSFETNSSFPLTLIDSQLCFPKMQTGNKFLNEVLLDIPPLIYVG